MGRFLPILSPERIVYGYEDVKLSRDARAQVTDEAPPFRREFESEAALVDAARALDGEAWSQIYSLNYERVYSYLYYRIGRRETAEDLAADVFVRALAGIRTFAYRGTPMLAWLFRIAHNVLADYRKAVARQDRHQAGGVDVDGSAGEDDVAEAAIRRHDVRDALRRLTDEQQQVLFLRFYEGMTNAEAGKVMGKGEGAVKALQNRAIKSMRRIMDDETRRRGA